MLQRANHFRPPRSEFELEIHLHPARRLSRNGTTEEWGCDYPNVRHVVDMVQRIKRIKRHCKRLCVFAGLGQSEVVGHV